MFKSKKAESENWTADTFAFYVIFCILASGTMFALIFLVNGFFLESASIPPGMKKAVLIDRFLSSPTCPALSDPSLGITSPLVIDPSKLNQAALVQCYPGIMPTDRAFQFTISIPQKQHIYASTSNWDSTSGVISREPLRKVIIKDGNAISLADLSIEVQRDK